MVIKQKLRDRKIKSDFLSLSFLPVLIIESQNSRLNSTHMLHVYFKGESSIKSPETPICAPCSILSGRDSWTT